MLIVYILAIHNVLAETQSSNETRAAKALSVFTVVRFPNDVCQSSTTGRNGTCYTASECAAKGGSSSGSCASSFGVCCVFERTCGGGNVAENCTYFTSSARTAGASCSLTVCKCSSDVCQLRLDFEAFTLSSPISSTTVNNAIGFSPIGNCDTDFFSVTVPGGAAPPLICGTNTGQHIYVPACDACNVLSGFFGSGTTTTTSAFTIKVTQVRCNSKLKAPDNCLQYFTESTGTLTSFNFAGGTHLANQDYCMCVRKERNACTICYSAIPTTANNLGLGGATAIANEQSYDTACGFQPGQAFATNGGATAVDSFSSLTDILIIPNGMCDYTATAATGYLTVDRYCGNNLQCAGVFAANGQSQLADVTANFVNTVCSSTKPFQVCIRTDGVESHGTGNNAGGTQYETNGNAGTVGFQLTYWQKSTCLLRN